MEIRKPYTEIPKLVILLLLLALTSACTDQSEKLPVKHTPETSRKHFFQDNHPIFLKWKSYYQSLDPNCSNIRFIQYRTAKTSFIPGNVYGIFDKNFDPVYLPFLVYSPDKTRYIDFDSYQWSMVNGEPQYEADQEVNLVDLENKTIQRIAFRGPSAVIEEVYWQNDSTVVLLENNDSVPVIHRIDLVTKTETSYTGTVKIQVSSAYSSLRLENKLNKKPD